MRLSGWIFASLLVLNACAQAATPLPAPDPVPADPVVMLPRGSSPSGNAGRATSRPDSVPSSTAPVATAPREWFYIHGALNVHAEPSRSAALVRTLRRGEYIQLGPKDANGWARLYNSGSGEAYVYRASDLVQRQAPAVRSAASSRSVASGGSGGSRRSSASGGSRRSSGSRVYHTGPRGGCYYYNGSGNKQYVDRSYCR